MDIMHLMGAQWVSGVVDNCQENGKRESENRNTKKCMRNGVKAQKIIMVKSMGAAWMRDTPVIT